MAPRANGNALGQAIVNGVGSKLKRSTGLSTGAAIVNGQGSYFLVGPTTITIYLTSSQTFTIPADWTDTNTIEAIGAGGNGAAGKAQSSGSNGGAGGGGGEYRKATNLTALTGNIAVIIGAGGSQTDTSFGTHLIAKSGTNAIGQLQGFGGSGGSGGTGNAGAAGSTMGGANEIVGGGGGGAGGPSGVGKAGPAVTGNGFSGGAGGGGSNGSLATIGLTSTSLGGAGGAGTPGTGGGLGGAVSIGFGHAGSPGGNGTANSGGAGGGGGGGSANGSGGNGGNGATDNSLGAGHGPGGGGGGGGGSVAGVGTGGGNLGGNGGTSSGYGAGGGGGGAALLLANAGTAGAGTAGLIKITYTSTNAGKKPTGTSIGVATVTGKGGVYLPPDGAVTAMFELNGIIYGMVGSAQYPGFDVPFAFKISTASFLPVAGVTPNNIPESPATSGDWTPPTMDIVSTFLVVTHPGFHGLNNNFFGWFDLTLPYAPVWNTGNVTPTAENTTNTVLIAPPTCCAQFNDRMYFAVGNALIPTDAGTLNLSNPGNVLILGNSSPITALVGAPLSTTSIAIFEGLIAFKGPSNGIFQVTGDPILNNWAENIMSKTLGTTAPRSVQQTPEGIKFMAVDGLRTINFLGLIGEPDPDIALPFINALYPTRASAGYNSNIYRICIQNKSLPNAPHQEYWQDLKRGGWTGPHTFQQDILVAYQDTFIAASNANLHALFRSDVLQTGQDRFIELGAAMTFDYKSTPMNELNNLYANSALKSTLEISMPATGDTYSISGQDEAGDILASGQIIADFDAALWDDFDWGDGTLWGASTSSFRPRIIPWTQPLVFNRLVEDIVGPCSQTFKVGSFFNAYERLNYMLP